MTKPPLTVINPAATGPEPPRALGPHGQQLWDGVMHEYEITDRGGVELLCLACETLDRVQRLSERINAEGEILRGKSGSRVHPGVKEELAGRAFVARTLQRLGLDVEPIGRIGRPPGNAY